MEGGLNAVISSLNMIHFDIPSWIPGLGGKSFGINLSPVWLPRIPQLAGGGYIRKATLAMTGEDGPEAVLPLKNNTQWMDALSDRIVDGFSQYKNVHLANFDDLSNMAKEYRPNFSQADARNLQRTMQMEYDVWKSRLCRTRTFSELLKEGSQCSMQERDGPDGPGLTK